MKRIFSGFTLLNLLITLSISSILATAGVSSLTSTLSNNQANNAYERLFSLVQFTRIQSVNHHSQVILCPTANQTKCDSDWNRELMVFVDSNNDEDRNNDELLLKIVPETTTNENLYWAASGSKRYLRFKPDGSTGNQNGRLTYCLKKGSDLYARQIIMYRTGRARKASQTEAEEKC
jgi:type IV fimbrial biogenesis protein FimT